jgi:signal transduction histidine kinase
MGAIRVLLVEDNPADVRLLRQTLADAPAGDFALTHVERLQTALQHLERERFDVVLLDLSLPDSDGLETFRRLHARAPGVPVVVLSGLDDETLALRAVHDGAQDYLDKAHAGPQLLARALRYAVERQRAEDEITILARFPAESPSPVLRVAADGTVLYANRASRPLLESCGLGAGDTLPAAWLPLIAGALAAGAARELEREIGSQVFAFVVAPVVDAGCVYLYGTDITERKRLERQFFQAQKMEAVGRLAGGVAHDFNNLLTVINGRTHLALQRLGPGHPLAADLDEIGKAGMQATAVTRQLLAFSRRQVLAPRVLDLNAIVAELEPILRRLIGEDVELVTALEPGLRRIEADPTQIQQVVVNLAVNARDAMPHGGTLTLETASVVLDEAYARRRIAVRPGAYVMLAVTDSGAGMDPETQARIFEPFFTTKEQGKGTGLGLATVYGIVKQSGGFIWVYSEPGRGSTFKVYLPQQTGDAAAAERLDRSPAVRRRGHETILLVEDAPMVRALAREVLERSGYVVLEAARGAEALQVSARHAGRIDLLLTDVVMPGMNGRELAERLRAERPGTRILYMSGYTEHAIVHQGVLSSGMQFFPKPFTPDALAEKVREVLDMPQAA